MKKWIALLLALGMTACLTGCGGKTADDETDALRQQRDALQQQVDSLRQENESLLTRRQELEEEREALQAQLEQLSAPPAATPEEENPIDTFYDAAMDAYDGTTVVMSFVASQRSDAWYSELSALAERIKAQLQFDEDKQLVDQYVIQTAAQLELMNPMVLFTCADITTPQSDRMMTAGTIRGVLWGDAAARIYRDAFYQLLAVDPEPYREGGYPFTFDADAARAALDGALLP